MQNRTDKETQATDRANEEGTIITRSGRASRLHDFKSDFHGVGAFYQDNADNNQNNELDAESEDCAWIKPSCYNEIGTM